MFYINVPENKHSVVWWWKLRRKKTVFHLSLAHSYGVAASTYNANINIYIDRFSLLFTNTWLQHLFMFVKHSGARDERMKNTANGVHIQSNILSFSLMYRNGWCELNIWTISMIFLSVSVWNRIRIQHKHKKHDTHRDAMHKFNIKKSTTTQIRNFKYKWILYFRMLRAQ